MLGIPRAHIPPIVALAVLILGLGTACKKNGGSPSPLVVDTPVKPSEVPVGDGVRVQAERFLYVASGACKTTGGVFSSTGLGTITKYRLGTGEKLGTVLQYADQAIGDLPVALIDAGPDWLISLVENVGGRRIDYISKQSNYLRPYYVNSTVLNASLRSLARTSDGGLLVTKLNSVEKITSFRQRVFIGANLPYINNPVGVCTASATAVSATLELPVSKKLLMAHAGGALNNRLILVAANGYNIPADCLAAQAAPVANAAPIGMIRKANGDILVIYSSLSPLNNSVMTYTLNETTNVFGPAIVAFQDSSIVMAPSAIVEDSVTGNVFIANSVAGGENIEKFAYDETTRKLARSGTGLPFIHSDDNLRCVSGMVIGK